MSAQSWERLVLNGEEIYMACTPDIPTHPSIVELDEIDPYYTTTACSRRYLGTWEIKEDKLYLVRLEGKYEVVRSPIFAEWVSDTIVIPEGERLCYVHIGFASIYEREQLITVVNGIVTKSEVIDAFDDPMKAEFLEGVGITRH